MNKPSGDNATLVGQVRAQQFMIVALLRALLQTLPKEQADELLDACWDNWALAEERASIGIEGAATKAAHWDYVTHARDVMLLRRQ